MIKIIFHANCSDGFCAAYLFWKKYGESAQYIPMNYGVDLDYSEFMPDDTVILTDFSFKRDVLLKLAEIVEKIIVLDHHKTAQEDLGNLDHPKIKVIFDMERSGARITSDYLGYALTPLVLYVEDGDLWRFNMPNSKEVSAFIQVTEFDFIAFKELEAILEDNLELAIKLGSGILMKLKQQIDSAVKHAILYRLGDYIVKAVNSTVNFSEVAGELAKESTFGVTWFYRSDGKYQYSLRSVGDFDVSKVAKMYGGGGHKNAAGFESNKMELLPIQPLIGKILKDNLGNYARIVGHATRGNTFFNATLPNCKEYYLAKKCNENGIVTDNNYFYITDMELNQWHE